jgi:hypothetical protein
MPDVRVRPPQAFLCREEGGKIAALGVFGLSNVRKTFECYH